MTVRHMSPKRNKKLQKNLFTNLETKNKKVTQKQAP